MSAPVSTRQEIGVIGIGTTGAMLVAAIAGTGAQVVAVEPDPERLGRAVTEVRRLLRNPVADRPSDAETAWSRIVFTTDAQRLAGIGTVIEAVPERLEVKTEVLRTVAGICAPEAVLVTSTTALSVTRLASLSGRPSRLLGLHLLELGPAAGVAEVVPTVITDGDALARIEALVRELGRTPVRVGDRPGLVSGALLFGYLNQAVSMYDQRFAGRDDIDTAMRLGCGLPLGPLETLDAIGVDTACDVLTALAEGLDEPSLAPARRLRDMVLAGWLGRKSGRGFYSYGADGARLDDASAPHSAPHSVPQSAPTGAAQPRPMRPMRRIGVVGSGTMATGIAEVCVKSGLPTVLVARSKERAEQARAAVAGSLDRAVSRSKLTADQRDTALALLDARGELGAVADCDVVIEAVVEDLTVKRQLFSRLGRLCRPGAVLATSTSSLPVIECALASGRPADVVGLHFFNPAPLMRLVEVIPSLQTAPDVVATARALSTALGKSPVQCADRPGFIVNALLFPYLNDAVRMVERHYAQADDIDTVMKLGCGYPLGPFELLDVIGLDVSLSIQQVLHAAEPQPRSEPAALLGHLVSAGRSGRKAGAGFRVHR